MLNFEQGVDRISRATPCSNDLEGLNKLSIGDRAIVFIPAKLGYGERGAGNVIPPNANIIFEIELLEGIPPPVANETK